MGRSGHAGLCGTARIEVAKLPEMTKPREVTWAIGLLWASIAMGPLVTAADWTFLKSQGSVPKLILDGAVTLAWLGFLTWKVSDGRNWARITLTAMFLLGVPLYFFYLRAAADRSITLVVLSALQALTQGAGIVLTFMAPGKHWFKAPPRVIRPLSEQR
jgi:hypothetical protein